MTTASETAIEQRNTQAVLRGWDAFNEKDAAAFVAGITPDYHWHSDTLPATVVGSEAAEQALQGFFAGFPDIRFTVDQTIATGEWVVVRFTARGQRTDGFMGLPPTDVPFEYHGAAVNQFLPDGKRSVSWIYWDRAYVLEQLGVLPQSSTGAGDAPGTGAVDAAVAPEEVLVRYGVGEGKVEDDPQYITLHIDLFTGDGEPGGYYAGIQQSVGPMNPAELVRQPPMPGEPIDQPGGIPIVPAAANYKSTWHFNDQDSITAVGASVPFLIPLTDGGALFMTTAYGLITGGTGVYEGCAGVKSAIGTGYVPPGTSLAPGTTFRAKTLDTFRVVRAGFRAPLPGPGAAAGAGNGAAASGGAAAGSPGGAPGSPGGAPGAGGAPSMPLPPGFPQGVDPETYKIDQVTRMLQAAAYLPVFSLPDPADPNVPQFDSGQLVAVEVNESLHRFDVRVEIPRPGSGLTAINQVGSDQVASIQVRWQPIPDDWAATPDRQPPPTPFDPSRSQRFQMSDGELRFGDGESGFRGFGTGRTFPTGGQQVRAAAVIEVLEGYGKLRDKAGLVVVNGSLVPPTGLALDIVPRFFDLSGNLLTDDPLVPVDPLPEADEDSTYLVFLGQPDPEQQTKLIFDSQGQMIGSKVYELLRIVELTFADRRRGGLAASTSLGPLAADLNGDLYFNPFSAPPGSPIPWQTRDGVFTFRDTAGREIGTLEANVVEGRAFATPLPGAPMPVFRFGGFGPFVRGTGVFAGTTGMMSVNAAISVFPRTLSNLYVLRVDDPQGRFRAGWSRHAGRR